MSSIMTWCNQNQGFLSILLTIGTIIISVVSICISVNTNKKEYRLNIFKLKQEIFDSFQIMNEAIIKFKIFDQSQIEILNNDMPNIQMQAESILESYEQTIEPIAKQIQDSFNKSEYIYLEHVSEAIKYLREKYLLWNQEIINLKKLIEEEEFDLIIKSIINIYQNTSEILESLDKASNWVKKDLCNYIERKAF